MSTIAKAFTARAQRGTGDVEFEVEVYYAPESKAVMPTERHRTLCRSLTVDPTQTLILLRGSATQQVDEPVVRDMQTLEDTARDLLHDRLMALQKDKVIHEFNIGDPKIVRWD